MEVAETLNGCRLTGAGSGVARRCDNHVDQPNSGILWSGTDAEAGSPPLTSLITDDVDNWTQRGPESVWLEYLYAWNPLAAGINHVIGHIFK